MAAMHRSVWLESTPATDYPPLNKKLTVDIAVIGAGFTGITCALLLKEAGLSVALIEANRIAEGVSGHTTAKITSQHQLIYRHLLDHFGREHAQRYAQANEQAIQWIRARVEQQGIACDFREASACVFAESDDGLRQLEAELDAARDLHLPASLVTGTSLPFPVKGALCFSNQAQFHPRKYLLALAGGIPGGGSHLFESTRALDIKTGAPCTVYTERGVVDAKDVIIATHFPITDHSVFSTRMTARRHYAIAFAGDGLDEMCISAEQPSHSLRTYRSGGESLILLIGEAHPTGEGGDTLARFHNLEEYARRRFGEREVKYRWSSQDLRSIDQVPYIGRFSPTSKHLYTATGFNAWGITHATVAAVLLSDLIQGKDNDWRKLYTPARVKPVTSAKPFITQGLRSARHLVADRLTRKPHPEYLYAGEGRIVRINGKNVAAYKDPDGQLFTVSAICPHMGCVVAWNSAERSWDCPCHGSRFSYTGEVLHGPAVKGLAPVSSDGEKSSS